MRKKKMIKSQRFRLYMCIDLHLKALTAIFTTLSSPLRQTLVRNKIHRGLGGGVKSVGEVGSRCVFQQGAAWSYSLMAADIYCPCLLWNPKTSWGKKNQPKPNGFGVLCRWAPHPRRFESALPEAELVPSAVQQKAWITGTEWSGAPAETHLLSFFFVFFL